MVNYTICNCKHVSYFDIADALENNNKFAVNSLPPLFPHNDRTGFSIKIGLGQLDII